MGECGRERGRRKTKREERETGKRRRRMIRKMSWRRKRF